MCRETIRSPHRTQEACCCEGTVFSTAPPSCPVTASSDLMIHFWQSQVWEFGWYQQFLLLRPGMRCIYFFRLQSLLLPGELLQCYAFKPLNTDLQNIENYALIELELPPELCIQTEKPMSQIPISQSERSTCFRISAWKRKLFAAPLRRDD